MNTTRFENSPKQIGKDARLLHESDLEHQAAICPAWTDASDAFRFYCDHSGMSPEDWKLFLEGWLS